ncbi:terpene synthase family protein [Streptomyces tanashiensis]|uniref:Terpene synthase n=1 Tax=Streptomyces tanashiensis TaxID=67367 RepID=A0ABY6QRZ5_9ACTN|nr:terpene synthase family protein [Streptomyces tanashiensis]UZX19951.1 terpene synthase family protein [Streptomyces tanashiensis]
MSKATTLDLPFPPRSNPHQAFVAQPNRDWLLRHEGLAAAITLPAYDKWDVPRLAAFTSPDSAADDLALAADLLSFYFLFDDRFDSDLGRAPAQVAEICARLTDLLHGEGPAPDVRTPVERAFADLWGRSLRGMSARWRARSAYNWEWYFACHPAEAAGRLSGRLPDRESYLALRRGTAAMETLFDMVERLNRFELPQEVLHHPVFRRMRQLAADIPSFTNDVHSYAQELARGDVANLVMIVREERGGTPEQAAVQVMREAQTMVDRFVELSAEVPGICDLLGLTPAAREAAHRYVDGLAAWIAGYHRWEIDTGRYGH